MSPAEVELDLRLDRDSRLFAPGDLLTGSFRVLHWQPLGLRAVELSVLWHTSGKAGEDIGVIQFRRVSLEPAPEVDLANPQLFSVALPASPLSYDGVIVKVEWLVRLRLFFLRGREQTHDTPFCLGEVPAAVSVAVGDVSVPGA